MWLRYLLLLLPFATSASIKLTKCRLSEHLLERRHLGLSPSRPSVHHDIQAGKKRNLQDTIPTSSVAPAGQQGGGTIYSTVKTTIYVQPSATDVPPSDLGSTSLQDAPAAGGGTIYTTVKVYVTVTPSSGYSLGFFDWSTKWRYYDLKWRGRSQPYQQLILDRAA
ncbi:uncharacterized protein MKK02DRAFT_38723 [Dioszegia hungarica]|uniref:Uncharacterized protein n=1 Tax=Dioszegia hungarica TaxID=4972 RepID=A0AA38H3P7_9TREE|nr:uncharacterized protein MKK02DRAFT_38723 [Dioszegia hungarica]KAI9634052.1 hypothetical protein MKK02DRAFT_38723 [Dioszegia hungarica]